MVEAGEDPRFIARRLVISGQRGHRDGRPDGAADRGRGRRGGALIGMPEGALPAGAGRRPPGHGAQVQRGDRGDRRAASADVRAGLAARCRRGCATPTTPARRGSGTARPTRYPHDHPRRRRPAAVPAGRAGREGLLPAHRTGAPRRGSPSGCAKLRAIVRARPLIRRRGGQRTPVRPATTVTPQGRDAVGRPTPTDRGQEPRVSAGEIAGLIAAVAFVLLVGAARRAAAQARAGRSTRRR